MRSVLIVSLVGLLASCTAGDTTPQRDPQPAQIQRPPIPFGTTETTAAGVCFAQAAPETQTRIVSEQVEIVPAVLAADGRVIAPPVFRERSRPATEIIRDGERFETLCPADYTPDRVRTLQRALTVRQAYNGPITGTLDEGTRAAIRAFQAAQGIDSPQLKRSVAETLGIVPVVVLNAALPET